MPEIFMGLKMQVNVKVEEQSIWEGRQIQEGRLRTWVRSVIFHNCCVTCVHWPRFACCPEWHWNKYLSCSEKGNLRNVSSLRKSKDSESLLAFESVRGLTVCRCGKVDLFSSLFPATLRRRHSNSWSSLSLSTLKRFNAGQRSDAITVTPLKRFNGGQSREGLDHQLLSNFVLESLPHIPPFLTQSLDWVLRCGKVVSLYALSGSCLVPVCG